MPAWLSDILPIAILLLVVTIVVSRLPKVDLGHSPAYLRRRVQNWLTVGLTYAFLYMGRYNLTVCATALGTRMTNREFGTILASGSVTYGLSFLVNGPLADRFGGRKTIIVSATGSSLMNLMMGAMLAATDTTTKLVLPFSILYSLNMYFQSFGAVSIIKVNSAWFHVRERGTFSGVFGILISLGVYFAFDWGGFIAHHAPLPFVFFIPAGILALFAILDVVLVRDLPSEAGFGDLDVGDASSGDDGPRLPVFEVIKKMLRDPIIITIALVEFCSGYLRDSITQWYNKFANLTGTVGFVTHHFGMLTCTAGIAAGVIAGIISDRVFHSRRGPVATVLYVALLCGTLTMLALLSSPLLGFVAISVFMFVIGVHGMLSGTASMDFGGKKNAGVAVGIIDGFVYFGVATSAKVLGWVLPTGDAMKVTANWWTWPAAMIPVAIIGLFLASRLWNAKPKPRAAAAH
jgi:OPA family glycerol-3-phosphate transporter-like MFS transporter